MALLLLPDGYAPRSPMVMPLLPNGLFPCPLSQGEVRSMLQE